MWSHEVLKQFSQPGSGGFTSLKWNGTHSLYARTWSMYCCGLGELYGCHYSSVLYNETVFNALKTYLKQTPLVGGWCPHEWLMCLSGAQLAAYPQFLKFKGVKLIDTFPNKAHDSSGLNIIRISDDV
jgi:hypothetical protein